MESADQRGAEVLKTSVHQAEPAWPRCLDLAGAAAYLSVSEDVVRGLLQAGQLRRVRLSLGSHDVRRILIDRIDVDELIARSKA